MTAEAIVCLIDGEQVPALDVSDSAVLRGDGCFEAIRSYEGALFRVDDHLERLERSAAALDLVPPARPMLTAWMTDVAAGRGDCVVRVVLTRGPAVPGAEGPGHCIVLSHPLPSDQPEPRLMPVRAPWHPAGRPWELAGVKTISYAPNQAAGRLAQKAGFDDALLVSDQGIVLEGPTFSVGWCRGGQIYTPSLELGILASVTRRVVMELADVGEVVASLEVLDTADEVFAMSTIKEVVPVVAVGDTLYPPGPLTKELAQRVGFLTRPGSSH